jgi:hypothetical protein
MTSGLRLMQSVATFRATVLTGANEDVPVSRYGGALIYIYIYKYTCIYVYMYVYIYRPWHSIQGRHRRQGRRTSIKD